MDKNNGNICQLLEMLDHPETYSEQEILDIINHDEDTRETYHLLVEAKRSSRQTDTPVDVDAAWKRFCQKHQPTQLRFGWLKIAAAFIGVIFFVGMAVAAIWSITSSFSSTSEGNDHQQLTLFGNNSPHRRGAERWAAEVVGDSTIVFDNVPLDQILPQIADFYHVTVDFRNNDARQLRFYFVWKPEDKIEVLIKKLNHFESLSVELKDNKIVVE